MDGGSGDLCVRLTWSFFGGLLFFFCCCCCCAGDRGPGFVGSGLLAGLSCVPSGRFGFAASCDHLRFEECRVVVDAVVSEGGAWLERLRSVPAPCELVYFVVWEAPVGCGPAVQPLAEHGDRLNDLGSVFDVVALVRCGPSARQLDDEDHRLACGGWMMMR